MQKSPRAAIDARSSTRTSTETARAEHKHHGQLTGITPNTRQSADDRQLTTALALPSPHDDRLARNCCCLAAALVLRPRIATEGVSGRNSFACRRLVSSYRKKQRFGRVSAPTNPCIIPCAVAASAARARCAASGVRAGEWGENKFEHLAGSELPGQHGSACAGQSWKGGREVVPRGAGEGPSEVPGHIEERLCACRS